MSYVTGGSLRFSWQGILLMKEVLHHPIYTMHTRTATMFPTILAYEVTQDFYHQPITVGGDSREYVGNLREHKPQLSEDLYKLQA